MCLLNTRTVNQFIFEQRRVIEVSIIPKKTLAALTALLLSGCLAVTKQDVQNNLGVQDEQAKASTPDSSRMPARNNWQVVVPRQDNPIKNGLPHDMLYAVISPGNDGWQVVRIDKQLPQSDAGQEILAVSRDLQTWHTTDDGWVMNCERANKNVYSACVSTLTTKDYTTKVIAGLLSFGVALKKDAPVEFDEKKVRQAVHSIAVPQANDTLASYMTREADLAKIQEDTRKTQEQEAGKLAAKKDAEKAPILADMARQPRGTEDTCKRSYLGGYIVELDPSVGQIECTFSGIVDLSDLRKVGWIVVTKNKDSEGIVKDYIIRKAR